MSACNNYQNGLTAAAEIACPVHVLIGEEDKMTPGSATRDLQAALAECHTTLIHGSGHMMLAEAPEATHAALVAAFRA